MIEQKKKEFASVIKEFYVEQKTKIDPEKHQAAKQFEKVQRMHLEFERFESEIESTPYEEIFKILNKRSQEITELES